MADPTLPSGWTAEGASSPPPVAPVAVPQGWAPEHAPAVTVEDAPPADPYFGAKLATNGPELLQGLKTLTGHKVSPEVIRRYVSDSKGVIPPETDKWLDETYAKNPGETNFEAHDRPTPGPMDSFMDGLGGGALSGWESKIGAGIAAPIAWGVNGFHRPISDIYNGMVNRSEEEKDAAWNDHPGAYAAGYIPGTILQSLFLPGGEAKTLGGRLLTSGKAGMAAGAIAGSGQSHGSWGDMARDTALATGMGLPLGMGSHVLGALMGRVVNKGTAAINNLREPLNSGLEWLSGHMPQQSAPAMADRVAAQADAGVPARLVDALDPSGRASVGKAINATHDSQQIAQEHANQVYTEAPERIAAQAHQMDPSTPTSRQLARAAGQEQNDISGPAFDAVRHVEVPITDDIKSAIETKGGRAALATSMKYMTPEEAAPVQKLLAAANRGAKAGTADPDEYLRQQVPGFDKMSDSAKDVIRKAVPAPADPYADVKLTVGTADKFRRVLMNQAGETPALIRVAKDLANKVDGAARQASPEYDKALTDFSARAGVGEAARGEGKFANSDFLGSPSDEYGHVVEQASGVPAAINETVAGDGLNAVAPDPAKALPEAPEEKAPTISELDAMRMRARTDIVDAATKNNGHGAVPVARQVAGGPDQLNKNEQLLGPEGADKLQKGMAAEVRRVDNTIDPRAKPDENGNKPMDAATATALAFTGHGKWHAVRQMASWLSGEHIGGVDAERLTRDAVSGDPEKLKNSIDFLVQRGAQRARAASMLNKVAADWGGRAAANVTQSPESVIHAPPSARSIYVTPTKQGAE